VTKLVDRLGFLARSDRRDKSPIRAEAPSVGTRESGVAVLRLYDPIDSWGDFWGTSASEFVGVLDDLDDSVTTIRLHINSPGGEVWDALAIYNGLRQHRAHVVVVVDGIAASAASVIAMAADELLMSPGSELMIHDAWGLCVGNAAAMEKTARDLAHTSQNIADLYALRAGGDADAWRELMREETWFTADEAVTAGLADRVLEDGKPDDAASARARFDLSVFAHAGRAHAPAPTQIPAAALAATVAPTQEGSTPVADLTEDQLTTMRQELGLQEDADGATILAALQARLTEPATPEQPSPTASLPKGVVTIDEKTLADLRSAAEAGQRAAVRQETEDREGLVRAAIADGRIAPARRDAWLAQLAADPGAADVLAGLTPGLIPVATETGHAGNPQTQPKDLSWFGGAPSTKETR